jgi:outer membrane protein assembly factor BamD (BamD/ComL family)
LDEKTKTVLLRCARVYISTKNWEKAATEYETLYRDFPDDPLIVEPLAKANYEKGNKMLAKDLYEKAMRIYGAKGDQAKAERIKADIARLFPAP